MILWTLILVLCQNFFTSVVDCKSPKPYNQATPNSKFDNPNFIRDRWRLGPNMSKPHMPDTWIHRDRKPFTPAWMDYCDPYHCNDYHKLACGLNRDTMRFRWFQSGCHLALNNMCYYHRGLLRYDLIDSKYCHLYVMQVRSGCPSSCEDDELAPVCSVSRQNDVVMFRSRCAMEKANCGYWIQPYDEALMEVCEYYWDKAFSQ